MREHKILTASCFMFYLCLFMLHFIVSQEQDTITHVEMVIIYYNIFMMFLMFTLLCYIMLGRGYKRPAAQLLLSSGLCIALWSATSSLVVLACATTVAFLLHILRE